MPISSSTEHWIKPDALTINLNHFGDPDYLQVSVLAGAVVMAFKQDVIGYNAAHNYRTWPLDAANTYLETSSAYNVYARLTRSEVNARALVVYDTVLRDIEGREITYAEDGSEVLWNANPDYFYMYLGQISASVNSNGESVQREWNSWLNTGSLQTNQQQNDLYGGFERMFRPHYDDPLNPDRITWIEALSHLGVVGGVTMNVDNGKIDLPSIYAGLPIDGKTIYWDNGVLKALYSSGGGEADSVEWNNIKGIPSWITNTKPKYDYSEIEGTPDLSKYALTSQIPSLSGYATESWVTNKGYATQSWVESKGYALSSDLTALSTKLNDFLEGSDTDTIINKWLELEAFLSGLSESDNLATILGTKADKTYVDGNFVTLTTQQTISGEKNFTGGLKVNGSPIVYDTTNKYWKLEGDLLVTGGVTMYANEGTYTPSTIMDAIAVDGTTISKDGGVLKVIGDLSGGVTDFWDLGNIPSWIGVNKPSYTIGELSNVGSWADSVASQDRIMYQAANSSQWVAKNLSDLVVGGVTGNYLPLSGGIIGNTAYAPLTIHRDYGSYGTSIKFTNVGDGVIGYIGVRGSGNADYPLNPIFENASGTYKIWHAGNDGSGSGLDADLLDRLHSYDFFRKVAWNPDINSYGDSSNANGIIYINTSDNDAIHAPFKYGSILSMNYDAASWMLSCSSKGLLGFRHRWWSGNGTVWSDWKTIAFTDSNVASATKLQTARTIWGQSFDGTGNVDGLLSINGAGILYSDGSTTCYVGSDSIPNTYISGGNVNLRYGTNIGLILNSSGNVGIGTTSPSDKLHVVGNVNITKASTLNRASLSFTNTSSDLWQISGRFNKYDSSDNDRLNFYYYNGTTWSTIVTLYKNGNMLVSGGVTMYSDARKKTILNHVELSLKEIAEAPLIEHYYNSDEKKTTHVGSIAQYWAGLNDWFCKLDNEGYYTMEIQNAALASAISVARELVKFETETDRRIRLLEEENEQLKKEIEILKWNIA